MYHFNRDNKDAKLCYKLGSMYNDLRNSLYYSTFFRLLIESYFEMAVMAFAVLQGYMLYSPWQL